MKEQNQTSKGGQEMNSQVQRDTQGGWGDRNSPQDAKDTVCSFRIYVISMMPGRDTEAQRPGPSSHVCHGLGGEGTEAAVPSPGLVRGDQRAGPVSVGHQLLWPNSCSALGPPLSGGTADPPPSVLRQLSQSKPHCGDPGASDPGVDLPSTRCTRWPGQRGGSTSPDCPVV